MARKTTRRGWLLGASLCAAGLISLAGCGVKRLPVSGTVTLDGKPLDGVVLTFSPDTAKGNTAQISCKSPVKEGRYDLQTIGITRSGSGSGVPPGWYKVTIMFPRVGTRRVQRKNVDINEKYLSVEKTPLEIEVKDNPEPGVYDLKLEK